MLTGSLSRSCSRVIPHGIAGAGNSWQCPLHQWHRKRKRWCYFRNDSVRLALCHLKVICVCCESGSLEDKNWISGSDNHSPVCTSQFGVRRGFLPCWDVKQVGFTHWRFDGQGRHRTLPASAGLGWDWEPPHCLCAGSDPSPQRALGQRLLPAEEGSSAGSLPVAAGTLGTAPAPRSTAPSPRAAALRLASTGCWWWL